MLNPKLTTYNDGVAVLMTATPSRFARGIDFSTTAGLSEGTRLAYRWLSVRAQDVDLADSMGFEVSMKVRCPRSGEATPDRLVLDVATGRLFEAKYVDHDTKSDYLYLAEITCDGTADLVSVKSTYDALKQRTDVETVMTVYVRRAALGYERTTASAQDALEPTASLTVRACDYADQTLCRRGGVTYTVTKVAGAGEWLTLSCKRKAGS